MANVETVGIAGAGTMGSGIAHVFARSGMRVILCDVEQNLLDRALSQIRTNLGREASKGKLAEAEVEAAVGRISSTTDHDALAGADFAIEAATERFELKANLFRRLDRLLPVGAILATNTSSISITKLAAQTRRPAQVIGMHFFNPVPVMALVEVIRGAGDRRRDLRPGAGPGAAAGQVAGGGERRAGVRVQPRADAADQRGGLCGDGGRGHSRSRGPGVQAGHGASHGAA